MFALQPTARHFLSDASPEIPRDIFDAMWKVFLAIGKKWGELPEQERHRTQLYNFMANRIKLNPLHASYYEVAKELIEEFTKQDGHDAPYAMLLDLEWPNDENPPTTPLAVARQMVSNEFISLYLTLGGFKAYGAKNYLGYIGGPYKEGAPVPYRTLD